MEYENIVKEFTPVNLAAIQEKIGNKDFLLFTARGTCPWCRKFAPFLHEVAKEKGYKIYYLNSINTPTDPDLKQFRDEHNIPTVPSLIYFKGDTYVNKKINITDPNFGKKDTEDFIADITK